MTTTLRASFGILVAATICSVWLLVDAVPHWQVPAVLVAITGVSTALVIAGKPIGFSFAQIGLFLLLLIGVVHVIGDPEGLDGPNPWPAYTTISPYTALIALCLIFLACVVVLRMAKAEMQSSSA
ncbi:hypothetical protein LVB87_00705 [Lysobacter sp. KIS68-7]|uniref:hypothetical protein n=1 Tax=Lysobacter sp. KIS68-7 TaxID=2904252 RepID=UPI001E63DD09|nr:hypothetical protein [Lysobacter sp. KIS68-7]UHQ19724.1 hypothetical protein LVB87_00705 [Lysobacter sp. KIS68-7]